jgi:hypothetical protein
MNNNYELLSNFDLIELAEEMNIDLVGVFSKDKLKSVPSQNGSYIINLDDFNGPGTHWVALFVEYENAIYFDPFGIVPPLSVIRYTKDKYFIDSNFIIQNLDQECCGYYCLGFLHFMTHSTIKNIRKRFNNFIEPFDLMNSHYNDNILQKYFINNVKI